MSIWERSGLLANSVCFVSKCVLWCFAVCFAVFCGCFAGILWYFASVKKKSVLRCFADVLQFFGRVLQMFL